MVWLTIRVIPSRVRECSTTQTDSKLQTPSVATSWQMTWWAGVPAEEVRVQRAESDSSQRTKILTFIALMIKGSFESLNEPKVSWSLVPQIALVASHCFSKRTAWRKTRMYVFFNCLGMGDVFNVSHTGSEEKTGDQPVFKIETAITWCLQTVQIDQDLQRDNDVAWNRIRKIVFQYLAIWWAAGDYGKLFLIKIFLPGISVVIFMVSWIIFVYLWVKMPILNNNREPNMTNPD